MAKVVYLKQTNKKKMRMNFSNSVLTLTLLTQDSSNVLKKKNRVAFCFQNILLYHGSVITRIFVDLADRGKKKKKLRSRLRPAQNFRPKETSLCERGTAPYFDAYKSAPQFVCSCNRNRSDISAGFPTAPLHAVCRIRSAGQVFAVPGQWLLHFSDPACRRSLRSIQSAPCSNGFYKVNR